MTTLSFTQRRVLTAVNEIDRKCRLVFKRAVDIFSNNVKPGESCVLSCIVKTEDEAVLVGRFFREAGVVEVQEARRLRGDVIKSDLHSIRVFGLIR
jgi:hypothetical protein